MSNSISDDINSIIKSLHQVIRQDLQNQSSTEQLLSEVIFTNCLQRLIETGNKHVLKNFSLRLQVRFNDSDKYHQHNYHSCNISEIQQEVLDR